MSSETPEQKPEVIASPGGFIRADHKQVGGSHYKDKAVQPWEVIERNRMGFFDGNALKYLMRYRDKGGVEDLRKAVHYIEKLIEMEAAVPDPKVGARIATLAEEFREMEKRASQTAPSPIAGARLMESMMDAEMPNLRDIFAMMALVGLVQTQDRPHGDYAFLAYKLADAMLAERSKT